jgi:hypothetical protein
MGNRTGPKQPNGLEIPAPSALQNECEPNGGEEAAAQAVAFSFSKVGAETTTTTKKTTKTSHPTRQKFYLIVYNINY